MVYVKLFINFFIIGCFSFGGGYTMLPLIDNLISKEGWMSTEQLTEIISISGMLPGSIGINAAIFVGYEQAGITGAFVSMLGLLSPSIASLILLAKLFNHLKEHEATKFVMNGLKAIIVGLIIFSAIKFSFTMETLVNFSYKSFIFLGVLILTLVSLTYSRIHPLMIILIAGIIGAAFL